MYTGQFNELLIDNLAKGALNNWAQIACANSKLRLVCIAKALTILHEYATCTFMQSV